MSGFEFKTIYDWNSEAHNKREVFSGNKESYVDGNTFDVSIGTTNKIYAIEYTQLYPGIKCDIGGYTYKVFNNDKAIKNLVSRITTSQQDAIGSENRVVGNAVEVRASSVCSFESHVTNHSTESHNTGVRNENVGSLASKIAGRSLSVGADVEQRDTHSLNTGSAVENVGSRVVSGRMHANSCDIIFLG
ncbi:hypothetical protein L4C34_15440 [Vibrio profundum]|uniref:hypothetical protein n=1 Tax=Vibrio profundum TaxID=2910247 RepID=UPI003D0E153B